MKKVLLTAISLILIATLAQALDSCQSQCGIQKNAALELVAQERDNLDSCKPGFFECLDNKNQFSRCKTELSKCKSEGKSAVKEKTVEALANYNVCIKSCNPEKTFTEIAYTESSFCKSMRENSDYLASQLGRQTFLNALKTNNCHVIYTAI